ncbi:cell death-inducing p53-target protein 1 homolog isoform X3 [Larimichthys crocea]|uniref:cell death-inducing p53-target protein 1 homolog isoform X3 n=1 Tax=Larimichthys crocea TaxID=215358 RepID=UPI000F5F6278|nr:cell death-inducing p53-target protein 1 homolog isoform X3 [Larimichthys crocea]
MSAPPYPGPPMGVYQAQPTIQIVNHVAVVQHLPTDCPAQMTCPHCQTSALTRTEYRNGTRTWVCCVLIGLFLCWPCCFMPFCMDSCKDEVHVCPSCNNVLYTDKRR